MSRRTQIWLLSLFAVSTSFAAITSAAWAEDGAHSAFEREAHISISPEGKITSLQFVNTKATKNVLDERLEPLIRTWSFEPGHVDGKPVATDTTLHLQLDMHKTGMDSYAVTLLNAFTGVGQDRITAPAYPASELKRGVEAKVTLLVSVSADGAPLDIRVEHIQSSGRSNDDTAFAQASIAAAKKWTYRPERVGGRGTTSVVRVPINFCMDNLECRSIKDAAGHSRSEPSGSVATLDSHARLVTKVAGTTF